MHIPDTEVFIIDMAVYIEINGERTDPADLDEDFEYYAERCANAIEGLVCSKHGETGSLSVVVHFAEPDILSSSKIEVSACCEDFEVEVFNKLLR